MPSLTGTMTETHYEFEWDEAKAFSNIHKHGVSFDSASSIFSDPRILTTADLVHSKREERWFSIGLASNGTLLSVAYLLTEIEPSLVKIRLISARKATATETLYYRETQ